MNTVHILNCYFACRIFVAIWVSYWPCCYFVYFIGIFIALQGLLGSLRQICATADGKRDDFQFLQNLLQQKDVQAMFKVGREFYRTIVLAMPSKTNRPLYCTASIDLAHCKTMCRTRPYAIIKNIFMSAVKSMKKELWHINVFIILWDLTPYPNYAYRWITPGIASAMVTILRFLHAR